MCEQNVLLFHEELRIRSKNILNKILLKNVQKALRWPLQYVNFQNFTKEHTPEPPKGVFVPQSVSN